MIDSTLIQQTISFLNGRLDQSLNLDQVAKSMGYSSSWLRAAFRKHTGQSLMAFHLQLRLAKAQELLRQTGLSVSEIAVETGFQSYTHFAHSFQKHLRTSPTEYRKKTRIQPAEINRSVDSMGVRVADSDWFADDFAQDKVSPWWKIIAGNWRGESGELQGESDPDLGLGLTKPLPENFRIVFELRVGTRGAPELSDVNLSMRDESLHHISLSFVLGARENTACLLARATIAGIRSTIQENSATALKNGEWQSVQIEMRGKTWHFSVDGREIFVFEETFAPPYKGRCRFAIGCSQTRLHLRKFRVMDLGFSTLVPIIGQGDALFQNGSYDQAREFYVRLLQSEGSAESLPELCYKIGLCLLRQAYYAEGRNWMNRALQIPHAGQWIKWVKLALLQADWDQNQWLALKQNALALLTETEMHLPVRELLERICLNLSDRGFHETAIDFRMVLEAKFPQIAPHENFIAESLVSLGRYAQAELLFRKTLENEKPRSTHGLYTRFSMADVLMFQGKHEEAMKLIEELRVAEDNPLHLVRCRIYEALVLQGLGDLEKSASLLLSAKDQVPGATEFIGRSLLMAVWPLCVLGKLDDARNAIKMVGGLYPKTSYLTVGTRSRYLYLPLACEGRFAEAAELFFEDSRDEDNRIAAHAEQAVTAGIFFELAGEKDRAAVVWTQTMKRYPQERCNFFGALAGNLRDGSNEGLAAMPYHPQKRSELAYWAGLLHESRGDSDRARKHFEMSQAVDLSRRWPVWMAREKLQSGSKIGQ